MSGEDSRRIAEVERLVGEQTARIAELEAAGRVAREKVAALELRVTALEVVARQKRLRPGEAESLMERAVREWDGKVRV